MFSERVVYRLFDIWEPYPIGLIEEGFEVGTGMMADDIVAGIYAWCFCSWLPAAGSGRPGDGQPMNEAPKPWKDALRRIPVVGVIVRAIEKSNQDHARDMAASIAYFSFFSLFPLLVGVVAGASLFLDRAEIESRLDQLLSDEFPGSADFLRTNIEALIDLRGPAGLASIVGLFWSASKMFGAVSRGINLAFGMPKGHPFYLSKLRYFAMTIAVSLLLFIGVGVSTALDVVTQFELLQFGLDGTALETLSGHLASFVFIFATVFLIYKLVPYERRRWRELLPGALVTALLFELGKGLFILYLDKVRSLEAIYGSLTSVIVLLLWLYFSARVLLFGAEICALRIDDRSASVQ